MLALLKASLWQTPDGGLPSEVSPAGWDEIGTIAAEQTVGALVADAALRLPAHLRPPKAWMLKAYSLLERNRRTHALMDECVARVADVLRAAGIKPVLLKGQAYAQVYPEPLLRQCGDIDFYVGAHDYAKACRVAAEQGWECMRKFDPEAKHYECAFRGVSVELHRIAGKIYSPSADRLFQQWSRQQLESTACCIDVGGSSVDVPGPMFDVVFVFMHLYIHFLTQGIGLRHLCDWAMLLHARHSDIDAAELVALLHKFKLLRGWRSFAPVAVDFLGLPPDECPLYSPRYRRVARRIMSHILAEGNFGKARQRRPAYRRNFLLRKASFFLHSTSLYCSKFPFGPGQAARAYAEYVVKGARRAARQISGKI